MGKIESGWDKGLNKVISGHDEADEMCQVCITHYVNAGPSW